MRPLIIAAVATIGALAAPRSAHANECNLYHAQTFGLELRAGCPVTQIQLPGVTDPLPAITRVGVDVASSIEQDTVELDVTYYRYPSPTDCNLVASTETKTFDRYVVTLPDLQAGEHVAVNGQDTVVLAEGQCAPAVPTFACADPYQTCDDTGSDGSGDDGSGDETPGDDDDGGCSTGRAAPGWLLVLGIAALIRRRARANSRRR
jgi:hypothetical protein